jgi:signal peptidase I
MLAAAAFTVGVAYAFLRWKPVRVEIRGGSMRPTLEPGEWALAVATRRIRRGGVVVVEHPDRPGFEMVKRVIGVPGDLAPDGRMLGAAAFWVEGDSPEESTDSRTFGPVRREHVKAAVRAVYWPVERRRLV